MAQVAVNKDGSEVIGNYLFRACDKGTYILESPSKDSSEFWAAMYNDPDWGMQNVAVTLPKGSIKKLTGKELKWEDEPIELKV